MSDTPPADQPPVRRSVRKPKIEKKSVKAAEPPTGDAPAAPPPSASPRSKPLMRGLEPQSRWFVGISIAGTLVHFLAASPEPITRWIGWAGPLAATLLYPAIGLSKKWHKTPASREKFADNSYYLGFIFTQVALIVGFVPMTFFHAELGSRDVLRAFSVALGASLIGLVVRTLLVQTSNSVTENADIVENEVEALARAVSRQTQMIVTEFEALGGRLTKTYAALDEELQSCLGQLAARVRAYEEAVARDVSVVETSTAAVADAAAETRSVVAGGAAAFVARTAEAASSIESVKDALQADLEEAIRALHATTEAIGKGAEALSQVPAFAHTIETLNTRTASVAVAVENLEARISEGERNVALAAERGASSIDQVAISSSQDLGARAVAFQSEVDGAVKSLEATLIRFKAELERLNG